MSIVELKTTQIKYRKNNGDFEDLSTIGDVSKEALLRIYQNKIEEAIQNIVNDFGKANGQSF